MRVSVIGAGFVGLVSAACLAEKGHHVTCVDVDAGRIRSINDAVPPMYEAGLGELLERNVGRRLHATDDLEKAVGGSDLSLIAVGTPTNGSAIDLRHVEDVSRDVGAALRGGDSFHTVVVKSTVVPGTTEGVVKPILEEASGRAAGDGLGLGMNPEFLRQGSAVADFMAPDRIVIGGFDDRSVAAMRELYSVFEGVDVVSTTIRTAEMIKYAANSLLATMISFSNEIANLSAAVGDVDAVEVLRGVTLDNRLSPINPDGSRVTPGSLEYLHPGPGFGGSCFPKDVAALIAHARQLGARTDLLEAVIDTNRRQPDRVAEIVETALGDVAGVRVAVLGLAFKPGTDDMRESPSIPIIEGLLARGADVVAHDPVAADNAARVLDTSRVGFASSAAEAVAGAEAVVVVTPWPEYRTLPETVRALESQPLVVDARRAFDKGDFARYAGIGL